jgi:hypothetical protein
MEVRERFVSIYVKMSPSKFPNFNNNLASRAGANVIKNTTVNYNGYFNPTFSRVKMMHYITVILG